MKLKPVGIIKPPIKPYGQVSNIEVKPKKSLQAVPAQIHFEAIGISPDSAKALAEQGGMVQLNPQVKYQSIHLGSTENHNPGDKQNTEETPPKNNFSLNLPRTLNASKLKTLGAVTAAAVFYHSINSPHEFFQTFSPNSVPPVKPEIVQRQMQSFQQTLITFVDSIKSSLNKDDKSGEG